MACVGDTVAQLAVMSRPIMPIGLRARIAYQSAVAEGRSVQETAPQSAAALEIGGLWREVEAQLWPTAVPAVAE